MTLILRSNSVALNNVGNIHGYYGPADYAAMLDFSRGQYYTSLSGSRVDLQLSDVVSVARTSAGVVHRRDGSFQTVPPNTPRITFLPDYDVSGLLIESARTNYVTSDANGASVSIPAAGEQVLLSFDGGDASLVHANLTLEETYQYLGRTVKRYSRANSTAITATLALSGGAQRVQASLASGGTYPGMYLGPGGAQTIETASISPTLVQPILGSGAGSVVARIIYNRSGSVDTRTSINSIALKSSAPNGGLYLLVSANKAATTSNSLQTRVDGSGAIAGTQRTTLPGNWKESHVDGVVFSGSGNRVGIISHGSYSEASGLGTILSPLATLNIGGDLGSIASSPRIGGVITHLVLYNRALTQSEALTAAVGWG